MSKEGATLTSYSGASSSSLNFTDSNDLYFGLRGAGASLGIVTEFLYTVHQHPETKAVILLVLVTKVEDLVAIESAAASSPDFQFGLYNNYFPRQERQPVLGILQLRRVLFRMLAWWHRESAEPLVLSVTDIRTTAGRHTNVSEVLDLVQSFKIRLAIQSPWLIEALSKEAGAILMRDYESEYMGHEEMEENGAQAVGSANLGGLQSVEALAPLLLADESIFGVASKYSETALAAKCDFCFLAVNFNRVKVDPRARISSTHDVGTVQVELTCTYVPGSGVECPRSVKEVRKSMLAESLNLGGTDSQYVNTPSCQDGHFGPRCSI